MKKIKKLVVGNWKMNPHTATEAKKIANDVKNGMKTVRKTQVIMCPPYVYFSSLMGFTSTSVFLGSQNAFYENAGPFTGEISYNQIHQFKVSHVIVGHSERRALGETDEMVNKKVRSVVGEGMTAIVCIGEKSRDNHGDYFEFIKQQIISDLHDVSKRQLDHVVIAYEPVWTIGSNHAMTTRDIHEMSIFIRKVLRDIYGPLADVVKILYGGSVTKFNAGEIVRDGFVQGLLVGRESLKAKNFLEIIKIVDTV